MISHVITIFYCLFTVVYNVRDTKERKTKERKSIKEVSLPMFFWLELANWIARPLGLYLAIPAQSKTFSHHPNPMSLAKIDTFMFGA